jgi:hypothetical protein
MNIDLSERRGYYLFHVERAGSQISNRLIVDNFPTYQR